MKLPDKRINNESNIKLLLCSVLYEVGSPVSWNALLCSLQDCGYVNYFDATSAFSELLNDDSICRAPDLPDCFILTEKGKMIAKELSCNLPLSVRKDAVLATFNFLSKLKREKENVVSIEKCKSSANKGFYVNASVPGGEGLNLISFSIYVPSIEQANLIKKNFKEMPELVYQCILATLTKNKSMIDDILRQIE